MRETDRPIRFERVLDEELDLIAKSRRGYDAEAGDIDQAGEGESVYSRAQRASLFGLALSRRLFESDIAPSWTVSRQVEGDAQQQAERVCRSYRKTDVALSG